MKRILAVLVVTALCVGMAPASAERVDRVIALRGAGTWIDVYDWAPSFTKRPGVTAKTMKSIAATGVQTVFIQASRSEQSTLLVNASTLRVLVAAAKANNLYVVLWYLPSYRSKDVERIKAMMTLAPDAIALDLESKKAPSQQQVLDLLTKARSVVAQPTPLVATVYPPTGAVITGRKTWSDFPWRKAAPLVDVWAVMAYWRESTTFSPAPGLYMQRSVAALAAELPAEALVHLIGGVATTVSQATAQRALRGQNLIGTSIYDWRSSSAAAHAELARE